MSIINTAHFERNYSSFLESAESVNKSLNEENKQILYSDSKGNYHCKRKNIFNYLSLKLSRSNTITTAEKAISALKSKFIEINKNTHNSLRQNLRHLAKNPILFKRKKSNDSGKTEFESSLLGLVRLCPTVSKIDNILQTTFVDQYSRKIFQLQIAKKLMPVISAKDGTGACAEIIHESPQNREQWASTDWDKAKDYLEQGLKAFQIYEELPFEDKKEIDPYTEADYRHPDYEKSINSTKEEFLIQSQSLVKSRIDLLTNKAVELINKGQYTEAKDYIEKREEAFTLLHKMWDQGQPKTEDIKNAKKITNQAISSIKEKYDQGLQKVSNQLTKKKELLEKNKLQKSNLTNQVSQESEKKKNLDHQVNRKMHNAWISVTTSKSTLKKEQTEYAEQADKLKKINNQLCTHCKELNELEKIDLSAGLSNIYLNSPKTAVNRALSYVFNSNYEDLKALVIKNKVQPKSKAAKTFFREIRRAKELEKSNPELKKTVEFFLSKDKKNLQDKMNKLEIFAEKNGLLKGKDLSELAEKDLKNFAEQELIKANQNAKNRGGGSFIKYFEAQDSQKTLKEVQHILVAKKRFSKQKQMINQKVESLTQEKAAILVKSEMSTSLIQGKVEEQEDMLENHKIVTENYQQQAQLDLKIRTIGQQINNINADINALSEEIGTIQTRKSEAMLQLQEFNKVFPGIANK